MHLLEQIADLRARQTIVNFTPSVSLSMTEQAALSIGTGVAVKRTAFDSG